MKKTKLMTILLAFLICGLASTSLASGCSQSDNTNGQPTQTYGLCLPKLPPTSTPVTMTVAGGITTYVTVTLSGVPSGYSVISGTYPGWCGDIYHDFGTGPYSVYLYPSVSSLLPASLAGINWNKVNYILNNKQGSAMDVQEALWNIINGWAPSSTNTYAWAMINAANDNPSYTPGSGDVMAVICLTKDWKCSPSPSSIQPLLIEVLLHCDGCNTHDDHDGCKSNDDGKGYKSNDDGKGYKSNDDGKGYKSNDDGKGYKSNDDGKGYKSNDDGKGYKSNDDGKGYKSNDDGKGYKSNDDGKGYKSNDDGKGYK